MKEYHVLSLSGGKDSTALAFFMKENMPEIFKKTELVFCDTEKEIPETYDYLNKIEIFLDKKITRLKPYKSFDHLFQIYGNLPSVNNRWCTITLKTQTFRKYMRDKFLIKNNDIIINLYIGIRADERERTLGAKHENIICECFPFVDNNITRKDVEKILISSGIGYPDYYKWRKRSGCYFCFYQSKMDWLNLYENHPDLYEKAMKYEYIDNKYIKGGRFGWNVDMSLKDIIKPNNIKVIKQNYQNLQKKRKAKFKKLQENNLFVDFCQDDDFENENQCKFCHI